MSKAKQVWNALSVTALLATSATSVPPKGVLAGKYQFEQVRNSIQNAQTYDTKKPSGTTGPKKGK